MATTNELLSREALARVLQSLLATELAKIRRRTSPLAVLNHGLDGLWGDDTAMLDVGPGSLACDSMEIMWLAAAANEMFHLHERGGEAALLSATNFGSWLDRVIAAWRGGVTNITFTTSGSSGAAKQCTHTFSHLQTEARYLADLFAARRRIVAMAPAHHIYGFLFTAVLPDLLGIAVLTSDQTTAPSAVLQPGDLVVSYPDRWFWLDRFVAVWPADIEGVVSTAPCPSDLIASLTANGLAKMTDVYGSSETAGIALRIWPDEAYRLMPHWRFATPIDPIHPAIIHGSGMQTRLMDRIGMRDDDAFKVVGRRDGAVQVGGINVYPDRITALLRDQPNVTDASVRLMRPDEGARLKAFIVPDHATCESALLRDLNTWCGTNLSTVERPKAFTFGSSLPRNAMGKLMDW